MRTRLWLLQCIATLLASNATADVVRFRSRNETITVEGRVLGRDATGTILLEGRDLQHYIVRKEDRLSWDKNGEILPPFAAIELRMRLQKEFGPRFKVRTTANYVICHSTSSDFAIEAGKLFERAMAVFLNYFKTKGAFVIDKPKQPLIAIVCSSRDEYLKITTPIFGEVAANSDGLYSPLTNRLYMFNAFGGQMESRIRSLAQRSKRDADAVSILLKERNVSVVIHEGIHQIAYNCGFHSRTATQPLWLVEGMAMFFESPDLDKRGGWAGVGAVNRDRLEQFRRAAPRDRESLTSLVIDDSLLRGKDALRGYAEAWAFTYFLNKTKTQQYMRYVKIVNARPPLEEYTEEERLRDFRTAFGRAPDDFEQEYRRYMARLNAPDRRKAS